MTEEEQEDVAPAVSEQAQVEPQESQEQEEQKMVPLAALQAERRKRQDLEARARVYEEMMAKQQAAAQSEPEEEEDPEALLTKGAYKQEKNLTKREILEQLFQDMNPKAVQKINTYLKPILDKKPWLAASLDTAVNRLARASEIVDDYMHLVEEKPASRQAASDAKRIIENSQKPRSPTEIGKSAQPSGTEYLKSIQGKAEFREYRKKLLSGG
jgi:hypothetical protein